MKLLDQMTQGFGVSIIKASSWDGETLIDIIVPTDKPGEDTMREVLLRLNELDDHDGMDQMCEIWDLSPEEMMKLSEQS